MQVRLTSHLHRHTGESGLREVAARLGRSYVACQTRMERLRKKHGHPPGLWTRHGLWTPEEDAVVQSYLDDCPVPDGTWPMVAERLNRTLAAVSQRAYKLRRKSA